METLAEVESLLVSVMERKSGYQPPGWAEGPFRGAVCDLTAKTGAGGT